MKYSNLCNTVIAAVVAVSASGAAMAQTALTGSDVVIPPALATPTNDLTILKTEVVGSFGTFAVVVTNTGPDAATGAVVTDTAGIGQGCPKTNAVTITGDGAPSGSFTVADLNGAGIALTTLQPGQSAKLTYSCKAK